MKKLFIFLMSVIFTLTACVEEISYSDIDSPEIYATIHNNQTKTVMDEYNNIRWSSGDQIVAFMKSSLGLKYQIKDAYVGKISGYFSKIAGSPTDDIGAGTTLEHNIAYYPYSESIFIEKASNSYRLDVVLPNEQTYTTESFGNGSMAMVAVTDNSEFIFKNVCGGIKLQLKGNKKISTIEIKGNNKEKLSGPANVYAYPDNGNPMIKMSSSASSTVVLNCGDGIPLNEVTPTEFIISLPPVTFSKGFVITITDTEGNEYELNSGKENEVKRSSLLVMPPIDIQEKVVSTRMLKLVNVDYDSYQVEITVPKTVGPDGNIVRYGFCSEAMFNSNINMGMNIDFMLQWNGGDINTTDINKTITNQATLDDEGNYIIDPIVPGEPTIFMAGEYTRDGQLVGEPEIIRFKTKEPSVLEEDIDVQITDISAIDATITIIPGDGIHLYCMLVLDEKSYNDILKYNISETDMQWFVSSYYAMYFYGVNSMIGSVSTCLSNYFMLPPADTNYHILITAMGNENGTSQCFKHVEFRTEKKKLSAPSILVTPLPEKSTANSAVFNIKCTSENDPNAGGCVKGSWVANYDFEWYSMLNTGYTLFTLLENSTLFTQDELKKINSSDGYEISIPSLDGMTMRLGVLGYNEEYTPNNLNYKDIMQCPAVAELNLPFLQKPKVESKFLNTDILEGEWTMTATDISGNPLETTVTIIRGYEEGRDYPSDCPSEFREQAEIFNQKRLADKNSLLLQGWFASNAPYGDLNELRTPYDLLIANDYYAYNYQQMFIEAGPRLIIEVDSNGDLIARTGEYTLSTSLWYGVNTYYMGLRYNQGTNIINAPMFLDFPIKISEDMKTMTISPVGDYYLNLLASDYIGGWMVKSDIKSDIVLKKK